MGNVNDFDVSDVTPYKAADGVLKGVANGGLRKVATNVVAQVLLAIPKMEYSGYRPKTIDGVLTAILSRLWTSPQNRGEPSALLMNSRTRVRWRRPSRSFISRAGPPMARPFAYVHHHW
jgi:hypothetical protein